ncbi:DUF302 domain-containing protein [Ferroplasma sp.]|uniref:DUF302 domain-containing protein n=1 Tax=Ferroplasma sp. TaxID=2591003 RepID=UPI00307D62DB
MYSYEKTYNKNAEEVFGEIHKMLKDANWIVMSYFDLKEIFTKMGKNIEPYYILDVCYPLAAVELINENADVGAFIPCKVVLIQHGKNTRVLMPKPSVLSREYLGSDGKIAEKYEKQLIELLDQINS